MYKITILDHNKTELTITRKTKDDYDELVRKIKLNGYVIIKEEEEP